MADVEEEQDQDESEATNREVNVDCRSSTKVCKGQAEANSQHHLQEASEAKAPPKIGPTPPARAQIPSVIPINRLLCL